MIQYRLIKIDDYWIVISDDEINTNDKFFSFFEIEVGCKCKTVSECNCKDIIKHDVYTCFVNYKSKFDNHITSVETGRNGDKSKHHIFDTTTCKKVLFSQNSEHNLPTITFSDEVAKELGIK